jgi:hypothetical protein
LCERERERERDMQNLNHTEINVALNFFSRISDNVMNKVHDFQIKSTFIFKVKRVAALLAIFRELLWIGFEGT